MKYSVKLLMAHEKLEMKVSAKEKLSLATIIPLKNQSLLRYLIITLGYLNKPQK